MALKPIIFFLQIYVCLQWCLKNTYYELAGSEIL